MGSNNMWAVRKPEADNYTDKYFPSATITPRGVANRVALGGLSIYTGPLNLDGDGASEFYSEERIATGVVYGRRSYRTGVFEVQTSLERHSGTVLTQCVWRPYTNASNSRSTATIEIATWATGDSTLTSASLRGSVGVVSRTAVPHELAKESPMAITGVLASTLLNGSGARILSVAARTAGPNDTASHVLHRLEILPNRPFSFVTSYSDTVLAHGDPLEAATVDLAAAVTKGADRLAQQSAEWWAGYWAKAAISLPGHPNLEYVWFTALFMGARDSSTRSDVAAPGLFGPMVTSDRVMWGGDFTLDFVSITPSPETSHLTPKSGRTSGPAPVVARALLISPRCCCCLEQDFEKQYFGVHGSNHGSLANPYFANILQYLPSAARAAQQWINASRAAGTLAPQCTPEIAARALHFPCHIGPFGFQSRDRSIYDHWNGELASLLFISQFEYYRDEDFARNYTYRLLDGLTAFRRCSLTRSIVAGGGHRYDILRDSAHEGFMVNNSVIANSFIRRTVRAQMQIGAVLGMKVPDYLPDMLENLVALPVAHVSLRSNKTGNMLHNVQVFLNEDPGPAFFQGKKWNVSIEPCLPGSAGWQQAVHCWNASGGRDGGLPSDHLAKYPFWPGEVVSRASSPALVATAQATARAYSRSEQLVYGRDTIGFIAAVVAGTIPPLSPTAWTAEEVVQAVEAVEGYTRTKTGKTLLLQEGNRMCMGMSRAIEEMLVSAPGSKYIELFPMWPRSSDASFHRLRVKGAFLVSANYSSAARSITHLVIEPVAMTTLRTQSCVLKTPWDVLALEVHSDDVKSLVRQVHVHDGLATFSVDVGRRYSVLTPLKLKLDDQDHGSYARGKRVMAQEAVRATTTA